MKTILLKIEYLKKAAVLICLLFLLSMLCGCRSLPAFGLDLALTLQDGETSFLDQFSNLKTVDLSGSTNYAEICQWASQHPDTTVIYAVRFPRNLSVRSTDSAADLTVLTSEDLTENTLALFSYLPQLSSVTFSGSAMTPECLQQFRACYPQLTVCLAFSSGTCAFAPGGAILDLSGISHSDAVTLLTLLPAISGFQEVTLGTEVPDSTDSLTWDDIFALEQAMPQTVFHYTFTLYGKSFSLTDSEMDLNHIAIDDGGALVRQVISCMPSLTYLDMDSCGVSDEDMAAIRDAFPTVKVVWRVWFGNSYSVRTDVEKILASCPGIAGLLTPDNTQSLKYCTDVKYIDVGHNPTLYDISFISYMPKLEVAILAMANFSDTSPIADCPELEFLEIQTNQITDLTPLSHLTKLRHLNIAYNFDLADISPLYSLTELERLWIGCLTQVPEYQVEEMQRCAPNCVINTEVTDPHDGWRWGNARYDLLAQQFGYEEGAYSFYWLDPKYYADEETSSDENDN